MAIRITAALVGAFSLLTSTAFAAPAAKKPVAKPAVAAKAVAAKPAAAKPAATQPAAAQPVAAAKPARKLPTGLLTKKAPAEPPPGVRVQPPPGQAAATPTPATPAPATAAVVPAAPAAAKAKPAPAKKVAAKPAKKKKQVVAKAKTKLKSGRAAASALASIDKNQLAVDHLAGAEGKSPLDLLASYKETVREGDFETAGVLLRLAAQNTPDHELITLVNDVLGISMNTDDTEILLQIARASRANAFAKDAPAAKSAEPAASPVSTRVQLAHATVESAPKVSRIEALGVYKRAVAEERPDIAAIALGSVVQGTLDEDSVTKANTLLGLSSVIPAGQIVAQAAPVH